MLVFLFPLISFLSISSAAALATYVQVAANCRLQARRVLGKRSTCGTNPTTYLLCVRSSHPPSTRYINDVQRILCSRNHNRSSVQGATHLEVNNRIVLIDINLESWIKS